MNKYDDIISLPCPTSSKHPRMSAHARAAQFSPFAALTGHEAAIAETARMTDRKIEISDDAKEILDERLSYLISMIDSSPEITVTYFVADKRKSGGAYIAYTGNLCFVDGMKRTMLFSDGTVISIDDVYDIECDLFEEQT